MAKELQVIDPASLPDAERERMTEVQQEINKQFQAFLNTYA